MRFLCGYEFSALLGKYQGAQLLDRVVGNRQTVCRVAALSCIPGNSERGFLLCHILAGTWS